MKDQEFVMPSYFMILLFCLFQPLWLTIVVGRYGNSLFCKFRWDRDEMESKQVVYFKECLMIGWRSLASSIQNTQRIAGR